MQPCDYFNDVDINVRRIRALTGLKAGGYSRKMAVALVALSEGETQVMWFATRPTLPSQSAPDVCCKAIIGIEGVYVSSVTDPKLVTFLQKRGWISTDPSGKMIPSGPFGVASPPQPNMLVYEYCVANAIESAAAIFAIGPTQIDLKWDGACGFPTSLVSSWTSHYSQMDEASLADACCAYLIPKDERPNGCLSAGSYVPDGANDAASINWLAHHVGNIPEATLVYNGDPSLGSRRAYKDAWADANTAADSVF